MSGDPRRLGELGEDIEWIANRVFIPASLTAFVSGILLVVESDFYGFGDDWIVLGLLLYATTFLAGLLFLGPESARIGKLIEERSPEAGPRTLRLIFNLPPFLFVRGHLLERRSAARDRRGGDRSLHERRLA